MTEILSIYAAVLSTILAIPTILDIKNNFFKPIRFIIRSHSGIDAIGYDESKWIHLHLFDFTIVNLKKESLHLSKFRLELKGNDKKKKIFEDGHGLINVEFPYKLDPGEKFREFARITDIEKNISNTKQNDLELYEKFRIIVESSTGKQFKSKWFNHRILYNSKTSKWEKLDSLEEYNKITDGYLK